MLPEFRTMFAGVRSARLAVLVESVDEDWQETCRRIIECLSTIWGGKYTILIPTDGNIIEPAFWKVLDAFDPDYICEYHRRGRDWRIARPEEFKARVERELQQEFPDGNAPAGVREHVEEAFETAPVQQLVLSDALQKELIKTVAPFHFEDGLYGPVLYAQSQPQYPLTAVATVLPHTAHVGRLSIVDVSKVNIPLLWVEAILGATFGEHERVLEKIGITVEPVAINEQTLPGFFGLLMNGAASGRHRLSLQLDSQTNEPVPDYVVTSPFALTMVSLSEYRPVRARAVKTPVVIVVGATLNDFALYFSLSRLLPNVYWLPPDWVNTFTVAFKRANNGGSRMQEWEQHAARFGYASLTAVRQDTDRSLEFLSLSLTRDALEWHIDGLSAAAHIGVGPTIRQYAHICEGVGELLSHPNVVFNTDNFAIPTTQQVVEGRVAGFFPTPKPKGFSHIVPYEHRWITEVNTEGLLYPRHPALGNWLVQHSLIGTGEARVGKRGVCYFCPSVAYFGGDVDTILVRPQIIVPTAATVFERLSQVAGWSTKTSDKGFFSSDTVSKMGGLKNAAATFRNPLSFALLQEYLRDEKDSAAHGIYLRSDRRRYLNLDAIADLLGDPAVASTIIDMLVQQAVLHRGTILKCEYCRTADWFSITDLANVFTCRRCRRTQMILSKHMLQQTEPVWYYQLDELAHLGLRNDMHVPLLALDYLRRESTAFAYTDELEIWKPELSRAFMEIDLCCVCDGVLTIGEAKTTERIESGGKNERRCLAKYREAAVELGARQFIVATAVNWSTETISNTMQAFTGSRIEVRLLQRSELWSGE